MVLTYRYLSNKGENKQVVDKIPPKTFAITSTINVAADYTPSLTATLNLSVLICVTSRTTTLRDGE
jgi:hypothetical protein